MKVGRRQHGCIGVGAFAGLNNAAQLSGSWGAVPWGQTSNTNGTAGYFGKSVEIRPQRHMPLGFAVRG